jgi:hypothetical protein
MTNDSRQAAIVRRWCGAVTAGDLDMVRDLVRESVEFHGTRGIGSGADLVVDWAQHSGVHITPLKLRDEGAAVVAECEATWPVGNGEATSARTQSAAMVLEFGLVDGRISSIRRFDRPPGDGESPEG